MTTEPRHTRVAAYGLCVDASDRVLLCRIGPGEAETGMWTLPGGGIDFGEDPAAAALRELEEEAGLTGVIDGRPTVDSRLYGPGTGRVGRLHAIRLVYRVLITGGTLRHELDGSTDMCAWFSVDEARIRPLVDLAHVGLRLAETPQDRP